MHRMDCPYCRWWSDNHEYKGSARLELFRHFDHSSDCAEQFNADDNGLVRS